MLEPRTLLSGVVNPWFQAASIYAAAVGAAAKQPWARVPSEANNVSPKFSDAWYFNNFGQQITTASQGPSTGLPGADVNATDAWDITTGNPNVVIAVFDTGVDLNNPDLAGNVWTNPGEIPGDGIDNDHDGFVDDVNGWNFVDSNNNVQDTIGHGTTVNGVLGAVGNNGQGTTGMAWNVKLMELKVGDITGVSDAALSSAINYVINLKQRGVNVVAINASYFGVGGFSLSDFADIKKAGDAGIAYVAASGNAGLNIDSLIPDFVRKYVPNFVPSNLIWVAATDSRDQLASFSDYGQSTVALAAPGVDITTPFLSGIILPLSGTSYSAPLVAGTIALMKSAVPGATLSQIENALYTSAVPVAGVAGKVTYGRLDAYGAIEKLLGRQPPRGNVDVFDNNHVVGWVFDPNAGAKPVTVKLLIDGKVAQTGSANLVRNDLTPVVGSANHGFSFTLPQLSGKHTVQVVAQDFSPYTLPLPNVTLKSKVLSGPAAPIGFVDVANATVVKGWTLDQDTPAAPVMVQVNVDGNSVGTATANLSRPDLMAKYGSANHGFSIDLPTLTAGFHTIDVYALDTTTNAPTLLGSRLINTNVPATGFFDAFDGSTLKGWAIDPDSPTTSIQVQYAIDGGAPILATANVNRPDLTAVFGSANHGFSITLPQLTPGKHTVSMWAIDPDNSQRISLGSRVATVANPSGLNLPIGVIDVATSGVVKGWTFDPSAGAAAIQYRVDVDGVPGTPASANLSRPDLVKVVGSANHGFSQTLSLTPGEHLVEVYALGAPSDPPVLIGQRVVGQAVSQGVLDVINGSVIQGWAFNGGTNGGGSDPVTVRLDIDGIAGPTVVASGSRPDLIPYVGSANHGFSFVTPSLPSGSHKISLVVIDPMTLDAKVVSTGTLVV
jgi:subtilisin family serine protease